MELAQTTPSRARAAAASASPARRNRRALRPVIARGLKGVVVTDTRLSHVDGERGELIVAGFPLEAFAPHATYEAALFLLWHDRIPTPAECANLAAALAAQRTLPEPTLAVLAAAAARALPTMDALRMAVSTLTLTDADPSASTRAAHLERALGLVARFPTIVATYGRLRQVLHPLAPREDLGHVANYLYMLTGTPPEPATTRALETYFNTVIDHGMNASTFTARVIVSTRSDMVSALVGAIGALKGPLHGGAPGPALDMVFEIQRRAAASGRSLALEAEAYVRETLGAGGRIMGFGHRVYKVRDPRADVLGGAATQLFHVAGNRDLYETVREVEAVVVRILAEIKPGRRLDTNVEFYTALLLHGVGLPTELFAPTFAVARAGGWTAHVLEQIEQDQLIRPESLYIGTCNRTWPSGH